MIDRDLERAYANVLRGPHRPKAGIHLSESDLMTGYGLKPERCVVFDLETIPHPELEERLGIEEDKAMVHAFSDAEMRRYADEQGIRLGNRKDPYKIEQCIVEHLNDRVNKAALKGFGLTICAAGAVELGSSQIMAWATDEDRDEYELVGNLVDYLAKKPTLLAGFNIRGFDLMALRIRATALAIELPPWFPIDDRADKYDRDWVYDARDVLTDGPLDTWLRMLDLPPKTSSGDRVRDMTPEQRRDYVAHDTHREEALIRKLAINNRRLRALSA